MKNYLLFLAILLVGCHSVIQENDIVISKEVVSVVNKRYRYEVESVGFNAIIYTTQDLAVGDTLKFR